MSIKRLLSLSKITYSSIVLKLTQVIFGKKSLVVKLVIVIGKNLFTYPLFQTRTLLMVKMYPIAQLVMIKELS